MKKITAGIISIGLCAALLTAGLKNTSNVSAEDNKTDTVKTDGTEQIGETAEGLINSFLTEALNGNGDKDGTYKEETVYVIADADGTTKKIIVSDWLKNNEKTASIPDKTDLKDIVNLKGDETYTQNGETISWNAAGADISYQGISDKALPVSVKVSYFMDGKSMTPEEIKGKTGHVLIRFDYENLAEQEVEVDGKKEKMTIPFTMLTGVILDDDRFTNITAKTAKLLNDGTRTVVVGISFPGIQENLGIDRDKFEIPDHLEIEADVKDFSLSMTVTAATTELFAGLDKIDVKSLDGISDSMGQLTSAMQSLEDGSESLSNGLGELLAKSRDLEDGITKLSDGAGKLSDGAGNLAKGAVSAKDGAGKLAGGIETLAAGTEQLKAGTDQIDQGIGQLAEGSGQLKDGLELLSGNNEALMGGALEIFNTFLQTAETQLKEAGADIPALTSENYGKVLDNLAATLSAAGEAMKKVDPATAAVYEAKVKSVIELKTSLDSYNAFYQGLNMYTSGVASAAEGAGSLKSGADQLKVGTESLAQGLDAVNSGAGELKTGSKTLAEGLSALNDGADQLSTGAKTLNNGLLELKNSIPALKDGITRLYEGSVLLKDGIKEFNEKGISKITEAVEGELEGLIERVKAMGKVAREYNNFAGIDDSMNGQVKFIIRTEEIK